MAIQCGLCTNARWGIVGRSLEGSKDLMGLEGSGEFARHSRNEAFSVNTSSRESAIGPCTWQPVILDTITSSSPFLSSFQFFFTYPSTMALQIGQTLHGAKWSCRLTEALGKGVHKSTIFKAQMLPGRLASVPAEWSAPN